MSNEDRIRYLRVALVVVGLLFLAGLYPLMQVWPAGWRWEPNQHEYEQMIMGVYAVLGVFLLLASRNPLQHLSLIWFTVWSSVAHGLIMAAQAYVDPDERGHFLGDIPGLLLIAIVLAVLTPRRLSPTRQGAGVEAGRAA